MIVQCQGCAAKYFLPEDKVPANPIKVCCPKCTAVFTLVPRTEPVTAGVAAAQVAGTATVSDSPGAVQDAAEAVRPTSEETTATDPSVPPAPEIVLDRDSEPADRKPKGKSKEARAKRLARVLVSDILCYNRDKRDQALQDGTLMTVLGEDIKKSWELYKEKVGHDVASSTNYFKEALNEILADGQEVF